MSDYYLGTMCGTSLDAFDVSVLKTSKANFKVIGFKSYKIDDDLRKKLRNQITKKSVNLKLDDEVSKYVSRCVNKILTSYKINKKNIRAIGYCGITLNHNPAKKKSLYIGNPDLIRELTDINVVANFRQSDIDFGGQGAPLTGYFQHYLSNVYKKKLAFLNLGGFANIMIWNKNQAISYDTGPANYLIDTWCRTKFKRTFDKSGKLAQKGEINNEFLKSMMKDHYFLAKPPKSTGFERFNLEWIMKHKRKVRGIKNIDVLATLTYLTISTVSIELSKSTTNNSQLYIYGGGVKNTTVTEGILNQINMRRLKKIGNGIDEKNFESACFAWLALKRLNRKVFIKSNITGREKNGLLGDVF